MRHGDHYPGQHDLSSLRLLGTVGEPINPTAWQWYLDGIGYGRCPIVDTWWQTETGGILISPTPRLGLVPLKPGSATFPLPGIEPDVVDEKGEPLPPGKKGFLIIRTPWPGMFMTLNNDPERYRQVYWTRFPGNYYPGDYALRDKDGYFWLLGRADEVKGEAIVAFVTLKGSAQAGHGLAQELRDHVRKTIGPIATPDSIYFARMLPKTRSGKIMRRVIKAVAAGGDIGDITTIEDDASIEEVKQAISALLKAEQQANS